mmetsp:Transcript_35853/g.114228  ORF Transcript_35853/g.114228 Transcript_35853/m.114228 type:complete len:206 (+) Transcript_35853:742-1359(+)|eukprot:scaffold4606_cov107-Isochrysis_galbana.AAC.3
MMSLSHLTLAHGRCRAARVPQRHRIDELKRRVEVAPIQLRVGLYHGCARGRAHLLRARTPPMRSGGGLRGRCDSRRPNGAQGERSRSGGAVGGRAAGRRGVGSTDRGGMHRQPRYSHTVSVESCFPLLRGGDLHPVYTAHQAHAPREGAAHQAAHSATVRRAHVCCEQVELGSLKPRRPCHTPQPMVKGDRCGAHRPRTDRRRHA